MATTPVVVLNGARTVGKSTPLHWCAAAYGVAVVDLDDLATRHAVAADPALFAAGTSPVCIDEFQQVLPLLDAIKAELNRSLHPGRYLLTGSTRYVRLPATSQSLTGRDKLGTAFVGGVVLYLGSRSYTREERIQVLPMDRLWS